MEVVALAITLYPASGQAMRHQDLQYRQELRVGGYRQTQIIVCLCNRLV